MGELIQHSQLPSDIVASLVLDGDLTALSPAQRVAYYVHRCRLLDIDPGEQPFQLIKLDGKLTLYASKTCANALTRNNKLSLEVRSVTYDGPFVTVTARASTLDGRFADDVGIIDLESVDIIGGKNKWGKDVAGIGRPNGVMKAVSKAKRRAVLALCGLGLLDDSEVDSVRGAQRLQLDVGTGEVEHIAGAIDTTAEPTAAPRTREQTAADQLTDLHADIAGRVNDIAAIMKADKSSVYCGAVKAAGLARGTPIESLDHMASVAVLERLYVKLAALRGEQVPDPAAELDAALTCTELYERLCAADPADYEPGNYKREWANMLALDEWPANPTPAHFGEVAEHITRILEKLSE
jgi:hypothetical protein